MEKVIFLHTFMYFIYQLSYSTVFSLKWNYPKSEMGENLLLIRSQYSMEDIHTTPKRNKVQFH